jgi:toxin ParE1/3/4
MAPVVEIIFHPEAEREYRLAREWYHERSPRAAVRFEDEVDRMLELVKLNPDSFPAYDDDHRFVVLRRFAYTIVYQVYAEFIFVVAVAQAGREPEYWKDRG